MRSLPNDLKNYRAPRSPWPWILGAALVVAVPTFVGPTDFAAELAAEADAKVLRPVLAIQITKDRKVQR